MQTAWLAFVGSFVGSGAALAIAAWIVWRMRTGPLATMDLIEHTAKQVGTLHDQLTAPNAAAPPQQTAQGTPVTPMQQQFKPPPKSK